MSYSAEVDRKATLMGNIYRSRPLNEIDITIQDLYNIVGNKIANEMQRNQGDRNFYTLYTLLCA